MRHSFFILRLAALIAVSCFSSVEAQVDILNYHGGSVTSAGVNSNEQQLSPSDVNSTSFGKLFTVNITDVPYTSGMTDAVIPAGNSQNYTAAAGQVYAEPLVKTGVNITTGSNQGVHDVVFVATSMDSLYAIDANTGTVLWKDSFIYNNLTGNPNPINNATSAPLGVTAVPGGNGGTNHTTEIGTGDLAPWVGIVGTPVIDGTNGYIYLVAKTREVHGGDQTHPHYVLTLHKVALANGADISTIIAETILQTSDTTYTYTSGPYVVGTNVGGTTVSGQSRIYVNAVRQMVRPALVLYNNRVYIASGSHGDNGPYHGWLLTYSATADSSAPVLNGVWNATPNATSSGAFRGEAGFWQGGAGPVIDSNGYIYVITGNGDFDGVNTNGTITGLTGPNGATGFPQNGNYGDCFVKLVLDPTTSQSNQNQNGWGIKVQDYFSPYNNSALDGADTDLGAGGAMILPDSVGSTAHPHLLIGGGKEGKLYLIDRDNMGQFGASDNAVQVFLHAVYGTLCVPAFFNGRVYTTSAYGYNSSYPNSGTTISWPITSASITTGSPLFSSDQISFTGCSPEVSANGTSNGIVWVIDGGTVQLRAYNASTMSELWTSNQNSSRDSLGTAVKFSTPTVANGHVYVGTNDHLVVYGPISTATSPPTAPSNLDASGTGPSTAALSWTDNSNNETGFRIERSSDRTNYTEIGTVGVNQTTYSDSGLSSQATYYYRVRAYNLYNTISYSGYTNVASATTSSVGGESPVYLYHLDEGAGTSTIDSVAGNNGTLIGSPLPSWITPGRIGNSNLSFSGNGTANQTGQSAVQVANDLSPVLGQTSSLLFWIKTTQTGNDTHFQAPAVTGVENVGGGNDINWGYLDSTGHIGIAVGDSGTLLSTNPINDGTWHHVAFTRDSTSGIAKVYIDGVLNATSGAGVLDTGAKTSSFYLIGALANVASDGVTYTGANFLNAQLDDVQIYNVVVDPSVIAAIAQAPAAPNLTLTVASSTELDLSWTENATNATEYEVWRSTSGGAFTQIAQLPANTVLYADTGLTPGTTYSYYVTAVNSAGSTNSNTVTATAPSPPTTPSGATVTYLAPTEIDLAWTDNATTETGYTVLRQAGGGPFTSVATLPANSTSFKDTTVQAGTTYDYHIEAYNSAGYRDFTGTSVTTPAQSQYASWFANYPSITNTSPTADPDNIGVPNLLAYAFNLNPTKSAVAGLPVATTSGGYLAISFVERIAPTDLTYTVQVSSDMVNWTTNTTAVSTTPIDSSTQTVVVRDNVLMTSTAKRFIRVQVTH